MRNDVILPLIADRTDYQAVAGQNRQREEAHFVGTDAASRGGYINIHIGNRAGCRVHRNTRKLNDTLGLLRKRIACGQENATKKKQGAEGCVISIQKLHRWYLKLSNIKIRPMLA